VSLFVAIRNELLQHPIMSIFFFTLKSVMLTVQQPKGKHILPLFLDNIMFRKASYFN